MNDLFRSSAGRFNVIFRVNADEDCMFSWQFGTCWHFTAPREYNRPCDLHFKSMGREWIKGVKFNDLFLWTSTVFDHPTDRRRSLVGKNVFLKSDATQTGSVIVPIYFVEFPHNSTSTCHLPIPIYCSDLFQVSMGIIVYLRSFRISGIKLCPWIRINSTLCNEGW